MPEVCRSDGILVYIYLGDHDPLHFHARRGDYRVKVEINPIAVTKGRMPGNIERRLLAWARELPANQLIALSHLSVIGAIFTWPLTRNPMRASQAGNAVVPSSGPPDPMSSASRVLVSSPIRVSTK